jgi:hypothetical protein
VGLEASALVADKLALGESKQLALVGTPHLSSPSGRAAR